MPNINIALDQELHRRLRIAAYEQELKLHEAVTQAIGDWVDWHDTLTEAERQTLLDARREARAAYAAGQITEAERIAAERKVRRFRKTRRAAREAAAEAEREEQP